MERVPVVAAAAVVCAALVPSAEASSTTRATIPGVPLPHHEGGSVTVMGQKIAFPSGAGLYFRGGEMLVTPDHASGGVPKADVTQRADEIDCTEDGGTGALEASYTLYGSRYGATISVNLVTNVPGIDNGPLDQDLTIGRFARTAFHQSVGEHDPTGTRTDVVKLCMFEVTFPGG